MSINLSADEYEFRACTQEDDGELRPPSGTGWLLAETNAAADGDAAVLIATWARKKGATGGGECPPAR